MKQQDLILAANSYAINNGDNTFDRKILRAAFKAGAAWFYEEPEPLDPHTCDLMVGDVVEWGGTRKVVTFIYDDGMLDIASKYSVQLAKRHDLVLTHRNGATIKEVGNE